MKRIYILALIIITSVLISCGSGAKKVGQSTNINDDAFIATTESSFKELIKASGRYDEYAIKQMISEGRVFILDKGTSITIVEGKFGMTKVRDSQGRSGWVSSEFVK